MGDPQPLRNLLAADPLLLTPEEAAELLRLGRTTVYALMKAGEINAVHIGRSCRISRAELERYVRRLGARAGAPAIERAQADHQASVASSSWTRIAGRRVNPQVGHPVRLLRQ